MNSPEFWTPSNTNTAANRKHRSLGSGVILCIHKQLLLKVRSKTTMTIRQMLTT